MQQASTFEAGLNSVTADQLRGALTRFLPSNASTGQKIAAVEAALCSPVGQCLREAIARWIVNEVLPIERLVPPMYVKWRPPVRDAMMFVVARLSPSRLAPKVIEQLEMSENLSPEERLLHLIAKVPGLQKLGQVIARNQHLRPALRTALARLENGIRDVDPSQIRAIIKKQLGERMERYRVEIASTILSEASVSAVIRFTWHNPASGRRERGVFKVLKPHIPGYFAEDMEYLQGLAAHFGERHHRYGFPAHLIPDTFKKVRRLLRHEINFAREQKTLVEVGTLYQGMPGVRVPQLIQPLCTSTITALSQERGIKVTNAASRLPKLDRKKIAERLIEALVAVPLFSTQENAIFHGDPHAGNLLYDKRSQQLTVVDWALSERLTREQRRHLALLFLMVSLRDPVGATTEILALSQQSLRNGSRLAQTIRDTVDNSLEKFPLTYFPTGADPMRLLERVALKGVKFPGPLVMLSKVMFTLDGILNDIDAGGRSMSFTIARHLAQHWVTQRNGFRLPLKMQDWIALQCSALLYPTRLWLKCEHSLLERN